MSEVPWDLKPYLILQVAPHGGRKTLLLAISQEESYPNKTLLFEKNSNTNFPL